MIYDNMKTFIADVPDYPKPGVTFRDITPLLGNAIEFSRLIDGMADAAIDLVPNMVVGIEARGFILGAPVADRIAAGFVPVRKPGKLPRPVIRQEYKSEYSTETLEMHYDALKNGHKMVIVDDILATGGTALAASELVKSLGGKVVGYVFAIELTGLGGRNKLTDAPVSALIKY